VTEWREQNGDWRRDYGDGYLALVCKHQSGWRFRLHDGAKVIATGWPYDTADDAQRRCDSRYEQQSELVGRMPPVVAP